MTSSLMFDWRSSSAIGRRRRIEVERDVMRLAVLGDAVGEGAQAPGLGLGDLPAIVGDDLGGVFRERIDLGLGQVLTREENMLVERHVSSSLFWPIADVPQWHAPPAVVKKYRRSGLAPAPAAGLWPKAPKKASETMNLVQPWFRCLA